MFEVILGFIGTLIMSGCVVGYLLGATVGHSWMYSRWQGSYKGRHRAHWLGGAFFGLACLFAFFTAAYFVVTAQLLAAEMGWIT